MRNLIFISRGTFVKKFGCILVLSILLFTNLRAQSDTTSTKRFRVTATGQQEDVQRYWGFDELNVERYLSLPYDSVMDTNLQSYFVQLGLMVLLFLPWAFMGLRKDSNWTAPLVGIVSLLLLVFWVPLGYSSQQDVSVEQAVDRLEEQLLEAREARQSGEAFALTLRRPFVRAYPGIHNALSGVSGNQDRFSYIFMVLRFGLGSFLLGRRMRSTEHHQQILVQMLAFYGLLWWFFSAGIPWYGLLFVPMLIVLSMRGVIGKHKSWWPEKSIQKVGLVAVLLVSLWSFSWNGALRMANYNPQGQAKLPFLMPVVEHQTGSKLEQYAFDRVYLGYQPGVNALNENEFELIYRAGTFMPFFVQKNDQRVFSDNFLDNFQRLYNRCPDKERLAKSLKLYGYSYLIVNLNLPTIDQTPGKTLTAKFNAFMDFALDNPYIDLVATDRIIRDQGNVMRFVMEDPTGTMVNNGSFAVFKLTGE